MSPAALLVLVAVSLWLVQTSAQPRRRRNPSRRAGRGRPVRGVFYRVIREHHATRGDFTSNRRRGRNPRGPELDDPDLHDGLSTFRDQADAHAIALDFYPRLGRFVQPIDVRPECGITGRKTPSRYPSHWTLWGDPDAFLACLGGPAEAVQAA